MQNMASAGILPAAVRRASEDDAVLRCLSSGMAPIEARQEDSR